MVVGCFEVKVRTDAEGAEGRRGRGENTGGCGCPVLWHLPRLVAAHLSDGEAVAKMGHPGLRGIGYGIS